jgi:hypothetical protein
LADRPFSAEFNLGIAQSLIDSQDAQKATLVSDRAVSFDQRFADDDTTSAAFGLRLGYNLTENVTIYGGYEGRAASDASGNGFASMRVSF